MLQVLPVVIFFSSVVSVLFHWGVMQYIVSKLARVMQVTMATTAAESLNAAANIFLGQVRRACLLCFDFCITLLGLQRWASLWIISFNLNSGGLIGSRLSAISLV